SMFQRLKATLEFFNASLHIDITHTPIIYINPHSNHTHTHHIYTESSHTHTHTPTPTHPHTHTHHTHSHYKLVQCGVGSVTVCRIAMMPAHPWVCEILSVRGA